MKKVFIPAAGLLALTLNFFVLSCKKHSDAPAKSQKYQIVSGNWSQSDIVLGVDVSVKVSGTKYTFPAGTSVITNPTLKAFGVTAMFKPTASNVYHFTDSGSYRIDCKTDMILPVAGSNGAWNLDVYDAVLKFTSSSKVNDPHWINAITSDSLSLSLTVNIPGMGTAPLSLLLHKQQ